MRICPKCKCHTLEFDQHQLRLQCLRRDCGWVNHGDYIEPEPKHYKFSEVMEERVRCEA